MKFKIKQSVILIIAICFFSVRGTAQTQGFSDIMTDLGFIQQNFQNDSSQYVGAKLTFLYSAESTPLNFTDSLNGKYCAAGNSRYVHIQNTETIQSDSMTISVYNDDKTIMVYPRVSGDNASLNQGQLMIGTLDSAFIAKNIDSVRIITKGTQKIMNLFFTNSSRYHKAILVYNATTYIPASIAYIMKQTKIPRDGVTIPDGTIITIRFSNYSRASFDKSILYSGKYVQIDSNGKATLNSAYSGFNIVQQGNIKLQGSSN